ncbi:transglycosylase SLT domain-containing protein [Streptomyces sp. ISL-100]|uniref:aggregation-promoting factor C-terminal-like domain-containing protein n=1 Tax=Streptomyces sp. ISL-100 TaxID=2819173 RepID=UPI001BEBAB8E|nr:transglycosylase SLT domain-containing protein [Streptomyces sp. ISL-100]MBT2395321.1 transglycosylase SLT domain-containing protein [Streptomyces sp. ISL-100]
MSFSIINRLIARPKSVAAGAAVLLGSMGVVVMGGGVSEAEAAAASPQTVAKQMIPDAAQYACFDKIVEHESGWNPQASNASSGAYGLVQALPASKMSSAGADWKTNPATQIEWGLDYMNERYGSPCDAWSFWQSNGWY